MSVTESIKSSAGIRNNDNIKYQVFPHVIDKFLSQIFFYVCFFLKQKNKTTCKWPNSFSRRFTLSFGLEHLSQWYNFDGEKQRL